MKKLLLGITFVVGLCVLVLIVGSFYLGSIVKAGVNGYAPKVTQTRVTLASASISPLNGSGTLRGLVVGNPAGWSDANLASLGRIHISVAPKSLFADHIVIDDIDIDAPEFDYETKFTSSNVGDLLDNVNRATGTSAGTATAKNGKPLKFEVRRLRVQNGVVQLGAGSKSVRVALPTVELTNIGTAQGGITSAQLVAKVTRALSDQIGHAAAEAAAKAGAAAVQQGLKSATDRVKGLFDSAIKK
jgi:uncharacterized protein involved in outer membrane biogenesis